jgi:membrane-bound inhibitor of C-type lysozyme
MKKAVFWDVAPCRRGATSQKTAFFIVTAVKTSNLTYVCGHLTLRITHNKIRTNSQKIFGNNGENEIIRTFISLFFQAMLIK